MGRSAGSSFPFEQHGKILRLSAREKLRCGVKVVCAVDHKVDPWYRHEVLRLCAGQHALREVQHGREALRREVREAGGAALVRHWPGRRRRLHPGGGAAA